MSLSCGDDNSGTVTDSDTVGTTESGTSATTEGSDTVSSEPTSVGPTGSGTGTSDSGTTGTSMTTMQVTITSSTSSPTTTMGPTTEPNECDDGAVECNGGDAITCVDGQWSDPEPCAVECVDGQGCVPCDEGAILCEGDAQQVCEGGEFSPPEACADDEVCVDGLGCVPCEPGSKKCENGSSYICNDDGSDWELVEVCDPVQGVMCNEDVGVCDGVCALDNLQLDYIGCDYYATVTQHFEGGIPFNNPFTVSISNTTDDDANITISGGALDNDIQLVVPANSVKLQPLPWVEKLFAGTGPSIHEINGAYRIRSDRPVTVVQYSPLESSSTNDASLLLPVNAWDTRVMVASFPFWIDPDFPDFVKLPGFYAVIASQDETTVTLTPSATGDKVQAGGGVAANGTGQVVLNQGDVLQVLTQIDAGDLTGTIVEGDKPISIIAGHTCTEVPQDINTCDHLEESMPPIVALSKEYVVVPPVQVPNDQLDKAQVIRVIATEDDTELIFSPDQGVQTQLASAGDFVEVPMTTNKFLVSSEKPILVAQFMVSAAAGFGQSDPSMVLAVGTDQWRADTLFHAPTTWEANYTDIIAPMTAGVSVDGVPVPEQDFEDIPNTEYKVAHVLLDNGGDGNHSVNADEPVGVSVYGVQSFGSYWAVGGLDLKHF